MKLLSHSAPIFPVNNPVEAAEYYQDVLGFRISFKWGSPPSYVVVNRDEAVSIHLVKKEGQFQPSQHQVSLLVFSHHIDTLYEEYQKSGAKIISPIADRDYGMRDFDIKDPYGFILSFAQSTSKNRNE